MQIPKLFSTYDPIYVEATHNDQPSLTKQAFQDEVDINVLKKRFVKENGYDPIVGSQQQYQIDFSDLVSDMSDVHNLQDVFDMADKAEYAFAALPAEKRALVHNDPAEFKRLVSTMSDEQLNKFGLFNSITKGADNVEATPSVPKVEPSTVSQNGNENA